MMDIKKIADARNKLIAKRPPMPFKEGRNQEELLNTGANARGLASMNTKKAVPAEIVSLAKLLKR